MKIKSKLQDYTEQEFLIFLKDIFSGPKAIDTDEDERQRIGMVLLFKRLTEHPAGSDLIFYPEADQEDSPEGVLKSVKEWREKNGKPGFKSPDNHHDQPHH